MTLWVEQLFCDLRSALGTGIAKHLRETYEPVTKEEIPPRQRDLLRQLEPPAQSADRPRGADGAAANRKRSD